MAGRSSVLSVAVSAVTGVEGVDEARLARAARAGDGRAFADLYQRYEGRLFNVAYRISGSEEIAAESVQRAFRSMMGSESWVEDEPELGPHLLIEARMASHDLMDRREGAGASAAANGNGELSDEQEEVGKASMCLPERQREALALRELGKLSYGEIAAIMETQHDSVAQLISRGRINLSDELHGTVLASVATPSSECEGALPLIAMREDGQLDAGSTDAAWLDAHLAGCERCGLGVEATREAAVSYRAWAPLAVAPSLLKSTMAMASKLAGVDWDEEIAGAAAVREEGGAPGSQGRLRSAAHRLRRPSRRAGLAAALAALLLLAGLAAIVAEIEQTPAPVGAATGKAAGRAAAAPRKEAKPVKAGTARGKTSTTDQGQALADESGAGLLSVPTDSTAAPAAAAPKPDNEPKEASVQAPKQAHQPSPSKPTHAPKTTVSTTSC